MNDQKHFDVIVIGVGSMGAPTCYYLAAAGAKVLGIEQFDIPHEHGSHAGQSRIIRKAYFEHPDYVPLLQRAYQNWKYLESISNEQVFFSTGLIYAGPKDHPIMSGVQIASQAYGIPIDVTDPPALGASYPPLSIPADYDCLFEPNAGFVTPEKSIQLYAKKAKEADAVIITGTKVENWKENGDVFEVQSTNGTFYSKKLVITSGAWTSKLIPALSVPLKVTRQVLAWVQPSQPELVALNNFPCWMVATNEHPGCFYGFPLLPSDSFDGSRGFKLAWHYPGKQCNPDEVNRSVSKEEEDVLKEFLNRFFPGLYVSTNILKTCLYTNSPDEHFIIDFLPGFEGRVAVAAGFSGHGFKFASVIGEILSEMALQGKTSLPVGFLGLNRFPENTGF